MKGLGIEKQNPSRRARRLSPFRRFELQGLGVVPNGTCLWGVSQPCTKCCSHAFWETNSLRSTMRIVECSLLYWWNQGRVYLAYSQHLTHSNSQIFVDLKEETEQAPSWKQDSILGRTVDFELYAQYLWKRYTNWNTRAHGFPVGRAPGLIPRLSVA